MISTSVARFARVKILNFKPLISTNVVRFAHVKSNFSVPNSDSLNMARFARIENLIFKHGAKLIAVKNVKTVMISVMMPIVVRLSTTTQLL